MNFFKLSRSPVVAHALCWLALGLAIMAMQSDSTTRLSLFQKVSPSVCKVSE